ncbi:MAG: hypothetical protein PHR77_14655 [Kiritimatiellae bacterium]|nr:hypothetical protein [Kiritimatiellia bacterium]MDD5521260.1 hypothetical protein [Kiritimatiellia bacterium]
MKKKRVIAVVIIVLIGAFIANFTLFKRSVLIAEYFVPIIIAGPTDAHVTAKLFITPTHHRYGIPLIYHRVKLSKPYQVGFEVTGTDHSFTSVVVNTVSRIDGNKVLWSFDNLNKVMTFKNYPCNQNPSKILRQAWSILPIRIPVTFQDNRTISLAVNYTLFPGSSVFAGDPGPGVRGMNTDFATPDSAKKLRASAVAKEASRSAGATRDKMADTLARRASLTQSCNMTFRMTTYTRSCSIHKELKKR